MIHADTVEPSPTADAVADLRRLVANGLSLTGAYLVPRLFTFAAAVVAARFLGVPAFGAYGSAAALAVIMSIASTLGVMQLLVRELARAPDRAAELIAAANVTKAVSTAVMLLAAAAVGAGALGYRGEVLGALMLLSVSYGIGSWAENLGAWFQAIERMEVWLQAQAAFGIVTGGLGILLAVWTRELLWFCIAPAIGQAVALTWLLYRSPPALRRAWRASREDVTNLLRALVPFATGFVMLTAYYKVDIVVLERIRGGIEAGVYAAAYKFVDVAQALAVVTASALYPRLSRLAASSRAVGAQRDHDGGRPEAGQLPVSQQSSRPSVTPASRALELILVAGVPAAGLLWLLRAPIVNALYGSGYTAAAPVLALLAPALPLLAVSSMATFILAASDRMHQVTAVYAVVLVLNVGLNLVWVPAFGALGSARAMLVSEFALAVLMLVVLGRLGRSTPRWRAVGPALTVAVGAAALAGRLALAGGPILYIVVVGIGYTLFAVVPAEERALLRGALSR